MSMTAVQLTEAQYLAKGYWGEWENRFSSYGAFKAFLDNAAQLLPQAQIQEEMTEHNNRTLTFPVFQRSDLAIITQRACAIAGTEPTAVKPTITDVVRGFEIKVYDKVGRNANFDMARQFAQQLNNGLRPVLASLDSLAASALENGKNTALAPIKLPGLTTGASSYIVDPSKRERLYHYFPTILAKNDMNSGLNNDIANTEARALMLEFESKGAANIENLAAVLRGDLPSAAGFRHYTSNRVNAGPTMDEVHYLVPYGAIGVYTWNDSDAAHHIGGPNGQKGYLWTDPIMGITWDVWEEDLCADLSGTYGKGFNTARGTKYQFAANFSFVQAYSSDSSQANIKVELQSAA